MKGQVWSLAFLSTQPEGKQSHAQKEDFKDILTLVLKILDCNRLPFRKKFVCVEGVCCVHTHMWRWRWHQWLLILLPPYIFESGSPTKPEVHQWSKTSQSASPRDRPVSTSPPLGFQVHITPDLIMRGGWLELGQVLLPAQRLCTCWSSLQPTEHDKVPI